MLLDLPLHVGHVCPRRLGIDLEGYGARFRFLQVDPAELSPGELSETVRDAVRREGRRVVVTDAHRKGVLDPMTAYQVVHMLEGVVQRGTATILRSAFFAADMAIAAAPSRKGVTRSLLC